MRLHAIESAVPIYLYFSLSLQEQSRCCLLETLLTLSLLRITLNWQTQFRSKALNSHQFF